MRQRGQGICPNVKAFVQMPSGVMASLPPNCFGVEVSPDTYAYTMGSYPTCLKGLVQRRTPDSRCISPVLCVMKFRIETQTWKYQGL